MKYSGFVRPHRLTILASLFLVIAVISAALLAVQLAKKPSVFVPPADAPSVIEPTEAQVDGYTVNPKYPRYLTIDKYNVKARILPLGVTKDNQLDSPNNVHDVGWYSVSSKPGQNGAMLMDGHVSSWDTPGVFYNLKNLVTKDIVQIERGDGTLFTYEVVATETYPVDRVDMSKAQRPIDPLRPGLNLITCGGEVIKGTNKFTHRTIVFTKQL